MPSLSLESPLGPLTLHARDGAITAVDFAALGGADESPLLVRARDELEAYFAGARRTFTLPLAPAGTPFQRRLWQALCAIPYGALSTYRDLAFALDTAPRAIGGACGANPIPILIPCHRVVATTGIGGYSGGTGLGTKRKLLALEGADLLAAQG